MRTLESHVLLALLLFLGAGTCRADGVPSQADALKILKAKDEAVKLTFQTVGNRKEVIAVEFDWGGVLKASELNCLRALPRLESLTIEKHDLTEKAMLKPLTKLTNLRALALRGMVVTQSVLRELRGLTKLEALELGGVDNDFLVELSAFRNLRSLRIGRNVNDAGLYSISRLPKLESLRLHSLEVTDAGLSYLVKLPLKRLDFHGAESITDAGLAHLAKIKTLEELRLYSMKVTDDGLKQLRPLAHLKSLDLGMSAVTGKGLEHLRPLKKLRVLNLEHTETADDGLASLEHLPLTELSLFGTKVTDKGMKDVARCKTLARLDVSRAAVTDAGLLPLAKNLALTRLSLARTKVTDKGVAALAGLSKLEELDLGGTTITDSCLPTIAKMRSLKVARVIGTDVTGPGMRALLKDRPKLDLGLDPREIELGCPPDEATDR